MKSFHETNLAKRMHLSPIAKEIAWDMVYTLPKRLFTSSETKMVDLAMGGGGYLEVIVERLRKYNNNENIKGRVFGFEETHLYSNPEA